MGLASELDSLQKKQKETGLTSEELKEFERLWDAYRNFNLLFGLEVRSFEEMQKGVMCIEESERPKGS